MSKSLFHPGVRALVGFVSFAALASGCAVGSGDDSDPAPQGSPSGQASEVKDPRDASGVEVCSLLKPQDVQTLNLEPQGQKMKDALDPSLPEHCKWRSPGGETTVSLSVLPGRSLQVYRDNSSGFVDYAESEIAGHPAVQANDDDPANGSCALYLATRDDEILYSFATEANGSGAPVDPCGLAKKALESSVPALPPVS